VVVLPENRDKSQRRSHDEVMPLQKNNIDLWFEVKMQLKQKWWNVCQYSKWGMDFYVWVMSTVANLIEVAEFGRTVSAGLFKLLWINKEESICILFYYRACKAFHHPTSQTPWFLTGHVKLSTIPPACTMCWTLPPWYL
jgi:hypothetical protein